MAKFLLDTSVVSEPLKPEPSRAVLHKLSEHEGEIAIPAPVWYELRFGSSRLARLQHKRAIERYIADVVATCFPVLEYDRKAADWHADECARIASTGQNPPFIVGQIAAISHVNRMVLVTSNPADFRAFMGLQIRSWL